MGKGKGVTRPVTYILAFQQYSSKVLNIQHYLIFREWMKREKGGTRRDKVSAVWLKSRVRIAFLLSSMEQNPPRIVPYMDTHFLDDGYAHSSRAGYQCQKSTADLTALPTL